MQQNMIPNRPITEVTYILLYSLDRLSITVKCIPHFGGLGLGVGSHTTEFHLGQIFFISYNLNI
jgi:hypothetical protein